jgi:hypothetical protein
MLEHNRKFCGEKYEYMGILGDLERVQDGKEQLF